MAIYIRNDWCVRKELMNLMLGTGYKIHKKIE